MDEAVVDMLNLDVQPGRRVEPLFMSVQRELVEEDLVLLRTSHLGTHQTRLKKIRTLHHNLARLIATGMKVVDVSRITGFAYVRLLELSSRDPLFRELVEFYKEREDARFSEVQDRMVALGINAADILQERMEEDPDSIPTDQLRQILASTLDRGGHAPVQKRQNLNVNMTAEELAEIKRAANERTVIESKDNRGDQMGDVGTGRAAKSKAEKAQRVESKGEIVREEVRAIPASQGAAR